MDMIGNIVQPSLGEQVNHFWNLDENINKFKRNIEELNSRREDIESKIEKVLHPGKKLKKQVEHWLTSVQGINEEKITIENEVQRGNCLVRLRLGKLVVEKIQEVEDLCRKGRFLDGLVVDAPPRKGKIFPIVTLVGETTAKRNMEETWEHLMSKDIRKICLYGMGGSGKTTILKHIHNRVIEENNEFDTVIWITASKDTNLIKLQNDIATALNIDIARHEDEMMRAEMIYSKLKEKMRYVLIFDDVWEAFNLEDVGIPEPTVGNGCKVILTTRSLDVCRRMNCECIRMELLSEYEAWNLFLDRVGRDVFQTPDLEVIAKQVAKECARLPLAIITIGGSMKGVTDEHEWRNALRELKKCSGGVNEMGKVIEKLKYSYTRLKDEKLQRCLLHCALYPEDYLIKREELIARLIAEEIVEGIESRQEGFDEGHTILNKLENACLLESCTDSMLRKFVKMHDLIRDMALQIIGQEAMVQAGVPLRHFPNNDKWTEVLHTVSLMNNEIVEIPHDASPRCSSLKTVLLLGNRGLQRIPDSLFVHMVSLRLLDISSTNIQILPNSISDLEQLRVLRLKGCFFLKYVPSLAKLRGLIELDLSWTAIEEVPHGLEMLVNLRYLDLYACQHLKIFQAGILPNLSHLQYLRVYFGSKALKIKGEELASLMKLETLVARFQDLDEFNKYVRSIWRQQRRLPNSYILLVGPYDPFLKINFELWEDGQHCKYVGVCKRNIRRERKGEQAEDLVVLLPNDVEEFCIAGCDEVNTLSNVLVIEGGDAPSSPPLPLSPGTISRLRQLDIRHCQNIKQLFAPQLVRNLQNLKEISVWNCNEMEEIVAAKGGGGGVAPSLSLPPGTFFHLKILEIMYCGNIKQLFTPWLVPHLQNLEEIYVCGCLEMKEIFTAAEGNEEEEEEEEEARMVIKGSSNHSYTVKNVESNDALITITFPKLRVFQLKCLPKLKSIMCRRGIMVCDSIENIMVLECPQLKRLPLSLTVHNGHPSPPPSLTEIKTDHIGWWDSLEWDNSLDKDVLQSILRIRR